MIADPAMPSLRILLADDNDANRLISRTILERSGHTVTTAQNGSHALRLAKFSTYDLVILDIMMPVMDGMRALRRLRRDRSPNRQTPVFALTAYCSAEDRQRYFLAGFDSVLAKPLRSGDLQNAYIRHRDKSAPPLIEAEEVPVSDHVPLLDVEMIAQLFEAGNSERLEAIQFRFWKSIEKKCETIKVSLPDAMRGESHSLAQFRRAVHAIKGASAAIGLSRVADVTRRLQNAPPSEIPQLMRAFVDALDESRPALTAAFEGQIPLSRTG